jgi:hypothetical protein
MSISPYAFPGCSSLTAFSVDIANPNYMSLSGVIFNKSGSTIVLAPNGMSGNYIIPNGVATIGECAFSGCGKLTGISIPDGVTTVRDNAFYQCISLTTITIPVGVTSLGSTVFGHCTRLTGVSIPASVTSLGDYAFQDCTGLTTLQSIPGVTEIGYGQYSGCMGLTDVLIPATCTSIGFRAFNECGNLISVRIHESVSSISPRAFFWCYKLTAITVDPANPQYSSKSGVLFDKKGATLLAAPGGISDNYAIPEGVTSIGEYAFADCYKIPSVSLPASVTALGKGAFSECSVLSSIIVFAATPPALQPQAFDKCAAKLFIWVPYDALAAYLAADGWKEYASIIVSMIDSTPDLSWKEYASITTP